MAPHSSTLAWKIPWTEEPGGLQSMGSLRVGHDWVSSLSRIGEGNGNPLQCSCLENPRDRGASWAANCGMAQSQTRLKRLSSSSSKLAKWPYERGDSPWGSWQRQRDAYSKLDGARLFNRQNGEKQEGWELSARPLECQSLVVTKILSLSCEQVWLGSWLQGWASRQVQQELPGWGQENYIPRCYEV